MRRRDSLRDSLAGSVTWSALFSDGSASARCSTLACRRTLALFTAPGDQRCRTKQKTAPSSADGVRLFLGHSRSATIGFPGTRPRPPQRLGGEDSLVESRRAGQGAWIDFPPGKVPTPSAWPVARPHRFCPPSGGLAPCPGVVGLPSPAPARIMGSPTGLLRWPNLRGRPCVAAQSPRPQRLMVGSHIGLPLHEPTVSEMGTAQKTST